MDSLLNAIELYYPKVRARFGWLLRDSALADDLSQEVFARLIDSVNEGCAIQKLWPYLLGIQRNVWLEHLRAKTREQMPLANDILDADRPGPAEVVETQDLHAQLRRLLEQMDAEEQAVIVGRHSFGMTGQQLSEWLSVPRRTLIDRYNRAMERLRRLALQHGVTL